MFTLGGLCSGIGGIEYAFTAAGFEARWLVEINPYCRRVLAHHWPDAKILEDVYHVGASALDPLEPVDVISAGFPCQPFSNIGRRRGEDDPRHLWPAIYRVISELKPRVVFLENVPGLRTVAHGSAFRRILREFASVGYDAEWTCLRAADSGAPHRRERLFVVAYANGIRQFKLGIQRTLHHTDRDDPLPESKRDTALYAPLPGRETVGSGARRRDAVRPRPESPVGPRPHGLSERLVGHQFPAEQGTRQREGEPPRLAPKAEDWKAKIEAIGNAVVPQVVYPVALAVREWLEDNP